ncbi:MAG: hypothetical protein ACNS62_01040 [Candidatus Cyclobacteriaceae bacterium M3_2C_046]
MRIIVKIFEVYEKLIRLNLVMNHKEEIDKYRNGCSAKEKIKISAEVKFLVDISLQNIN